MGTLVGLGFRVGFGVHLHVGLAEEGQRTNFTPVENRRQKEIQKRTTRVTKNTHLNIYFPNGHTKAHHIDMQKLASSILTWTVEGHVHTSNKGKFQFLWQRVAHSHQLLCTLEAMVIT